MSATFPVVNYECPDRAAEKCFLAHAPGVVKIAWYGDAYFKQRAVAEFLVAEDSVMNTNKG
jgi:hypothetical protein